MAAGAPFRPAAKGHPSASGPPARSRRGRDVLANEVIALTNVLQLPRRLDQNGMDMAAVFADYTQGVRRAISVGPTDTSSAR